jgi:hypothetical protein
MITCIIFFWWRTFELDKGFLLGFKVKPKLEKKTKILLQKFGKEKIGGKTFMIEAYHFFIF